MRWLDSWDVRRILDELAERHLTVVLSGDEAAVKSLDARFPFSPDRHRDLVPHLAARRAELVAHFRDLETSNPARLITEDPVTSQTATLTPAERRAALFRAMTWAARAVGGFVAWYSQFTRATGRVGPGDTAFPPDATAAAVHYGDPWQDGFDVFRPAVVALTEWHDLPNAFPPRGWKPPDPDRKKKRFNPWASIPEPAADAALPD